MGSDLMKIDPKQSWSVAREISAAAANSGLQGMKNQADLALRIQFGMELGLGPAQSLLAVQVVQGRPQLTGEALAAQVLQSGVYTYMVQRLDETGCAIEFRRHGEPIGVSEYTAEDAKKAKLWGKAGPWTEHPRNMLFARALRNGVRWYCPDVVGGAVLEFDPPEDATVTAGPVADVDTDEEIVVSGEVVEGAPTPVGISNQERRRLFAAMRDNGYSEDDLRAVIVEYTGQDSTKGLDADSYARVFQHLMENPAGAGATGPDDYEPVSEVVVDGQEDLFGDES